MKLADYSTEEFIKLLQTVVDEQGDRPRTRTQVDFKVFLLGLTGQPYQVTDWWVPWNDAEVKELMGQPRHHGFVAALYMEARWRFLATQKVVDA